MKNKIEDLRNHLFETLEALKDPDKPMEIARAREVANVAKVIVDSARAEVDFLKATGSKQGTGFIPATVIETGASPLQLAAPKDTPLRKCATCKERTAQDPCHACGAPAESRRK